MHLKYFLVAIIFCSICSCMKEDKATREASMIELRFATYNAALNRDVEGKLIEDLSTPDNQQAKYVAEIIQRVQPDILALLEFDYDDECKALRLFQENYLGINQNGADTVHYPYYYVPKTNTGYPTGLDLNNDGKTEGPENTFGYGAFPGQYGFAILSRYPIDFENIRTFQNFLWKDMPGANLPQLPESGGTFYQEKVLEIFRLSSKNHVDIPVMVNDTIIHVIVAHPTPPVFDGPEDRNGKRNHDEIRLLADYISGGEKAAYLYDDRGLKGGFPHDRPFVIMGDMNADPIDGDSFQNAIDQLLAHPKVNRKATKGKFVPKNSGGAINMENKEGLKANRKGDPVFHTAFWGMRIDYVIPSKTLDIKASGIFWPGPNDPHHYLVKDEASSDHLLVWLDVVF